MNQNFTYTDQKDIDLEVTLKTGEICQGLRCFLLRTYSRQYDSCDAHAIIYGYNINGLKVNEEIVDSANYGFFNAPDGRVWKVESYEEIPPPDAPGLIFRLSASS